MARGFRLTTPRLSSQQSFIPARVASSHAAAQVLVPSVGKAAGDGTSRCPHLQREVSTLSFAMDEVIMADTVSKVTNHRVNSGRGYEDIPRPKGSIPFMGTWIDALRHGVVTRVHEYVDMRYKQLGPIYREKLGKLEAVYIFDPQDVQRVFMREGRHPRHVIPEAWLLHREITDKPRGLFFMDGEEWLSRRRVINQLLLHPRALPHFSQRINDTINDLIKHWTNRSPVSTTAAPPNTGDPTGQSITINNIQEDVFNWSIECVGTVLFNQRLGCLASIAEDTASDTEAFVQAIQDTFRTTMVLTLFPPKLARALSLPVWWKFVRSMDTSLTIARRFIDNSMKAVLQRPESETDVSEGKPDVCSSLMALQRYDLDEVAALTADLFSGAAHTISNALAWAFYLVGQDQRVQDKIYEEVQRVVGSETGAITPDMLKEMVYVKAVIRETLRLYPIVPFHTRYLYEDISIQGYTVPANTLIMMPTYSMGRDEKTFAQADKFLPERWLRKRSNKAGGNDVISEGNGCPFNHGKDVSSSTDTATGGTNVNYATIPFAVGARACVGRRLAETEMHLMLAKVIKQFRVKYTGDGPVGIDLRMITAPKDPIKLRLELRDSP
ncbi:hypothetical protein RvY_14246 [Ramazzottius varieornatus]|uniref:Cytochrome P450 n=1 Tax=Ramazzottius varieornatus TaxID=947166 RepID=A0A1D1VQL8_RAMVA|nr:hypothetical protein RvY_14246 [Ramazzottius varieornatus]